MVADPNKWRAKIKELQDQLIAAQIADDSVRVKKLKEDLRRVASVPFNSKIKKIESQALNRNRLSAPPDRNAVRQDLLNQEQKELRRAQGLETEKPEDKFGGGPTRKPFLTKAEQEDAAAEQNAINPDFGEKEWSSQSGDNAPGRNVPANRRNPQEKQTNDDRDDSDSENGPNIRNAIANRAIDYAKKAALQAGKRAAAFLAANPYAWVVLGITLLIMIGVFAVAMSMLGGKVNTITGGTFTQAADPLKDSEWINKVLSLAGDKDIGEKIASTYMNGLNMDLTELKNEAKDDSDLTAKIQKAIDDLNAVKNSKSETDAEKFIADLKAIISKYENTTIPSYTANPTRTPLDNITGYNTTLHGGTYLRHEAVDGHGTYTQNNKGTCDAVDVYGAQSAEVHPIFGGEIISSVSDEHGAYKVIVKSGDYYALYAHMKDVMPKNKAITINDVIGKINKDHVHVEVSYKGKCVTTTTADKLDRYSSNPKYQTIGAYLWDDIKAKFNIS